MTLLGDVFVVVVVIGIFVAITLAVIVGVTAFADREHGWSDRMDRWVDRQADRLNDWIDRRRDRT